MIHLILGGARSGKSRYGETQVTTLFQQGFRCHYIATAQGLDSEMRERIARHQMERAAADVPWILHEWPVDLASHLAELSHTLDGNSVVMIDCLTLWLTNELLRENGDWPAQKSALLALLPKLPGHLVMVSNEVGSGIVPMGELSRQFVDEAGWLNQAIAAAADEVTLVVAGLPLTLKPPALSV